MNKLYEGDCVDILPMLEAGNIDTIITDPPCPDYYINEFQYSEEVLKILDMFNCRQFVFWSAKIDFPLSWTARHVWDKITGAACQYDFIYERNGYKRQKVFRGHRINSTVSAQFAREKFTGHKAQKPLAAMEAIILYGTKEGNMVLDPFMGSGTTGVACKNTGRNFIGIEKDPAYFKIAEKRIQAVSDNYKEK